MSTQFNQHESYLKNLLIEALPSTQENFEKVYIDHLQSIIDIVFSDEQKLFIELHQVNVYDKKAIIDIIVANKDVIFNGLAHSNLMKNIKDKYSKLGMKKHTIDNLIKAEFYYIDDILECKSKDFIRILSNKIAADQIGKTYEDTVRCLDKAGYNTTRLGFPGKNSGQTQLSEKEFKRILSNNKEFEKKENNLHNLSIETNCPCCGEKIKISISKI